MCRGTSTGYPSPVCAGRSLRHGSRSGGLQGPTGRIGAAAKAAVGAGVLGTGVFTDVFTDVFTGVFTDVFTDVFPDVVTAAFFLLLCPNLLLLLLYPALRLGRASFTAHLPSHWLASAWEFALE